MNAPRRRGELAHADGPVKFRFWAPTCLVVCCLLARGSTPARCGESEAVRRAPNIVLILADDLGYGDVGAFGATDLHTPNIDRLAADGMKFTQFYANCTVCSPTRAALLTGRYPDLVGVPGVIRTHAENSWGFLDPRAVLLPTVLKQAGYRTAMVGKWHLGLEAPNLPNLRGFDHFHGFLGDMMDDYYDHRRHGQNYMRLNGEVIDPEGHATELFTEWAVDWLRSYRHAEPFFLYLAYNAPHSPVQPPDAWLGRYRSTHPGVPELRARLAALVEHLDWGVGQVLAALEETGRGRNTIVVFSSDNGGSLPHGSINAPWSGGKQDMLEGGLRVPTCITWPVKIAPGSQSDRVVMTMDLFATFCETAGSKAPGKIDGRSILPTLLGRPQPPEERYIFWPRLEGGPRYRGQPYYAARRGDWKLLQNGPDEPLRLYDLAADPREQNDLAAQQPEHYARLKRELNAHIGAAAEVPWRREAEGGSR